MTLRRPPTYKTFWPPKPGEQHPSGLWFIAVSWRRGWIAYAKSSPFTGFPVASECIDWEEAPTAAKALEAVKRSALVSMWHPSPVILEKKF